MNGESQHGFLPLEGLPLFFHLQPSQTTSISPTSSFTAPNILCEQGGDPQCLGSLIPWVCSRIINLVADHYSVGFLASEALSCVSGSPCPSVESWWEAEPSRYHTNSNHQVPTLTGLPAPAGTGRGPEVSTAAPDWAPETAQSALSCSR